MDIYLEVCLKSIEDRKVLDDLLKYGQQDSLNAIILAAEEVSTRIKTAIQEYSIGGQNGMGMVTHTRSV